MDANRLPVVASAPLVETTVIEAKQGKVIPVINWTRKPIQRLRLTINFAVPEKSITLASGAPVQIAREGDGKVVTFDLDVADALILRREK